MKPKPNRLISRAAMMLLTVLMAFAGAQTAWATTGTVSYIDADGQTQSVSATVLTGSESSLGINGATTWYVVNSNISHSGLIQCQGNVNIILADGCKLTHHRQQKQHEHQLKRRLRRHCGDWPYPPHRGQPLQR